MFAGRYVWWLITTSALLLIFLFGFDGVAYLTIAMSDCERNQSCYGLTTLLLGQIKPMLSLLAGVALCAAILIRILWLRFLPLWAVPVIVWAMAIGGALYGYLPLWHGGTDYLELARSLPPATYAFVALAMFLAFPLEDEDDPQQGQAAPLGVIAGFAAFMCTVQVLMTASGLPLFLLRQFHAIALAGVVAEVQALGAIFLQIDGGGMLPHFFMVMLFALALALRIVRHEPLMA